MMKKLIFLIVPILITFLISSFAWADSGDKIFRFGIEYVSPSGGLSDSDTESVRIEGDEPGWLDIFITQDIDVDSAIGYGIGFEYMVTDLVGIDFNLNYSKHDVEVTFGGSVLFTPDDPPPDPETAPITGGENGEIGMIPLTVGVNFHFSKSDAIDYYLGPFIGYVFYDDLELEAGFARFEVPSLPPFEATFEADSLSMKNDFTFGATFGIDVPIGGEGWMFSAVAKYYKTEAEIDEDDVEDGEGLDMDPWVILVGLGYRF